MRSVVIYELGCSMQGPGPSVDWNTLMGDTMNLKILELDEEKDRLVLSNRKNAFNTRRQITVSPLALHCDMLKRIEFLGILHLFGTSFASAPERSLLHLN